MSGKTGALQNFRYVKLSIVWGCNALLHRSSSHE